MKPTSQTIATRPPGRQPSFSSGVQNGKYAARWRQTLGKMLSLSNAEASIQRRGFDVASRRAADHLVRIGETFITGYNLAVSGMPLQPLQAALQAVPKIDEGFAFEGAAMGLEVLDALPGSSTRFNAFCASPAGARHIYMLYVGAGWAWARLPWRRRRRMQASDPLLRWLALDGLGFHCGYFHWRSTVDRRQAVPRALQGYERRAFDQGVGRSLWFVCGAQPDHIEWKISRFDVARRADLWSGAGLAAAYAGGASDGAMVRLRELAKGYEADLAQGAAFAAKARHLAGNLVEHTQTACTAICGVSAQTAAGITDAALLDLQADGEVPAFEVWRVRIRGQMKQLSSGASALDKNPHAGS